MEDSECLDNTENAHVTVSSVVILPMLMSMIVMAQVSLIICELTAGKDN